MQYVNSKQTRVKVILS